jgi:DinB family protein
MEAWLNRLRAEIEQATSGLAEPDWRRGAPGRWNIAQIVEHLGKTYSGTAKMLERNLETNRSAEPGVRPATLKERIFQFLVVTMGSFPSGRKAPDFISPQTDPGPNALPKALSALERMREALALAEKRWGSKPVMAHFALGPMNASQWRKFHYVHGHHHIRQIRERLQGKAG